MASGEVVSSAVVLLTNKECPWRCLMCDLWQDTTRASVPVGAIPRQLIQAARTWQDAGIVPYQVKLYNSGSFFDPAAIPPEDDAEIARHVSFASNIVVESHPRLVGGRTWRLRDRLAGSLEVAMGLETAHPGALQRLNKGFGLAHFAGAAEALQDEGVSMRAFLLVHPPFIENAEALSWLVKSAEFAFSHGATAISLIPTRPGNGAMDQLREAGVFSPPALSALEQAQRSVLASGGGRVFADTWNLEQFSTCSHCFETRRQRLQTINLTQMDLPPVTCSVCGGT